MHVDAESAAIDLRNPQVHEVDQFFGEAALLKLGVHPAEGLETLGRSLGVVDPVTHLRTSLVVERPIVPCLGPVERTMIRIRSRP